MTPGLKRITLDFNWSDKDIVGVISNSTPPDGVTISKPTTTNKAGSESGGVYLQLAIQFVHDFHDLAIGVLGAWLYDKLKQGDKKRYRINNKEIVLNKRNIIRVVKKQLANQNRREAQYRRDKNRQLKKRS